MIRRSLLATPLIVLLAACGGSDGATLRGAFRAGQLPDDGDTLYVRTSGAAESVPVLGGAFELAEAPAGAVTLHFARGDDSVARMELGGVPEGGAVELRGIRVDGESGLAYPASVGLDGAETVMVNGLRYAARPLPREVNAEGTVLAAADEGEAFLVRPTDASLPDLRVVVGPLTETTTPDGDPVPPDKLERGDSVRIEGTSEGPYLLARRIVAPRSLALREAGAGEVAGRDADERPREAAQQAATATAAAAVAAGSRRGGGESRAEPGRKNRGRDEKPGKGRGRGRGKGKG